MVLWCRVVLLQGCSEVVVLWCRVVVVQGCIDVVAQWCRFVVVQGCIDIVARCCGSASGRCGGIKAESVVGVTVERQCLGLAVGCALQS